MAEKAWIFSMELNSCFSTLESSKFTNNQNVPTFTGLVLEPGNVVSVDIQS